MEDYAVKLMHDMCEVINGNPLPISVKYFIIKDIFNETQEAYNGYLAELYKQKAVVSEEEEKTMTVEVPIEKLQEQVEE